MTHLLKKVGKCGITLYQSIIPVIAIKAKYGNLIGYRAACLIVTVLIFLFRKALTAQVSHEVNAPTNNRHCPLLNVYAGRAKLV